MNYIYDKHDQFVESISSHFTPAGYQQTNITLDCNNVDINIVKHPDTIQLNWLQKE